jgi:hypothetical protein
LDLDSVPLLSVLLAHGDITKLNDGVSFNSSWSSILVQVLGSELLIFTIIDGEGPFGSTITAAF